MERSIELPAVTLLRKREDLNKNKYNLYFRTMSRAKTPELEKIRCEKLRDANKGENHPQFGKKRSKLTRTKISKKLKGKIVSKETCKKMGKSREGENNPLWQGGSSFLPYCQKFNNKFKERVRKFFGHTCQVCGHVWQPGEKKLAVHHVNYKKDACCNPTIKPYFVPVCAYGCHGKTGGNRAYWEKRFITLIELKYGGNCYV